MFKSPSGCGCRCNWNLEVSNNVESSLIDFNKMGHLVFLSNNNRLLFVSMRNTAFKHLLGKQIHKKKIKMINGLTF
jgi:hypothetical protein